MKKLGDIRKMRSFAIGLSALALAATAGLFAVDRGSFAADHLDPPARTDPAVDTTSDKGVKHVDIECDVPSRETLLVRATLNCHGNLEATSVGWAIRSGAGSGPDHYFCRTSG